MRFFFYLLIFAALPGSAQITDNFTDGDFTNNPVWSGDASEFIVNTSKQLQLNNTVAGASYLSTPSPASTLNNTEWRFYIKQSFAPSSLNYGRVYLASDQANLEGPLNGYYLQFGESGSMDAVELLRQTGVNSTSIARGNNAEIANSFAIGIKVTRNAAGLWSLSIDLTGGTAYTFEISGNDNTYTTTSFWGVATVYSSSNAAKFYFDNFYNGPLVVDVIPPTVLSAAVISSTQLDVSFSEAVDIITSQTAANYTANNSLGNPASAMRDANNFSLVHLIFTNPFLSGLSNTLTVINVQDLSSNALTSNAVNFTYYLAKPFDIVINEIMADPDPPVGLPNYEYAELFNKTTYPINLNNWTFATGSTIKFLPNITIPADSFLVLTSTTAKPNFDTASMLITDFSSFSLTNTGQTLTLKNPQGAVISTVSYTDQWYQDANKMNGGWSLEQIDPNNPCAGTGNWRASVNITGGTPGRRNSVNAVNADIIPPQAVRVGIIAADTIQLYFNESLDSTTMLAAAIYTVDNGIGTPSQVRPVSPDFLSVKLALAAPLLTGTIYTISVNNAVTDCAGNAIGLNNTARFAIPVQALPNDIVINEILYDPNANGVDFVEIYNRSAKVIDLKTIFLSQFDTINNVQSSIKTITTDGYLIFPGDYVVLSADGNAVKSQYNTTNPKGFLDLPSMITMNISGGTVCLSTASDIIDNLKYYSNMQFPLLNSSKGVSLERVDFNRPTQDRTNWHSAAQDAGFATPAYKNSQYNDGGGTAADNAVEITPEIFSPDEDGINDIVNINYHFDTPGFTANITIYDSKGLLTKQLVRNQLLGIKGTYSWDGINDNHEKSRIGIYIVFVEVFDLAGTVKSYKKTCVLGGKI